MKFVRELILHFYRKISLQELRNSVKLMFNIHCLAFGEHNLSLVLFLVFCCCPLSVDYSILLSFLFSFPEIFIIDKDCLSVFFPLAIRWVWSSVTSTGSGMRHFNSYLTGWFGPRSLPLVQVCGISTRI